MLEFLNINYLKVPLCYFLSIRCSSQKPLPLATLVLYIGNLFISHEVHLDRFSHVIGNVEALRWSLLLVWSFRSAQSQINWRTYEIESFSIKFYSLLITVFSTPLLLFVIYWIPSACIEKLKKEQKKYSKFLRLIFIAYHHEEFSRETKNCEPRS